MENFSTKKKETNKQKLNQGKREQGKSYFHIFNFSIGLQIDDFFFHGEISWLHFFQYIKFEGLRNYSFLWVARNWRIL